MTDAIPIRAGERGLVRVFSLDLPETDVPTFTEPSEDWPLKEALGADRLDPDEVEVFPASDLKGLGLSGYLAEGLGVAEEQIARDTAILDALQGHVVVLRSAALGGEAQTLRPKPPLHLVGTYAEERAPVSFQPLPDEGARGSVAPAAQGESPRGRAPWPLVLLLAALVLLGVGVLAIAFAGGAHV